MRRVLLGIAFLMVGVALRAELVSVGSYNVENYLVTDRMVEGVYRQAYPKPESEKAAVVAVIKVANPDVLMIEEMGSREFFEEFKARLKAAGLVYPYCAWMESADTQRHLAVVSKKQFKAVYHTELMFNYEGRRERVLRGILELNFTSPEGGRWRTFGVHLKSRYTNNDEDPGADDFRQAEAKAMRERILSRVEANEAFLVTGDFNDEPKSAALKRFLTKGKRTLLIMQRPVDSRGEVWTHFWEKHSSYSRIDYLLTSIEMSRAVVPGSARIIDAPEAMEASDHRLVMLTIDTAKIGGQK